MTRHAAFLRGMNLGGRRLTFAERQLYWLPDGPMSRSELDLKTIERRLGTTTIRTARTVGRMVAKYF